MKNNIKVIDVNSDYINSYSAVPFTLNKKTTGKYIYSWNTSPKFFPDDMKDSSIRIRFVMDNAKMVGLDELIMPDQQLGDKLVEECHELTFDELKDYFESDLYKKQGTVWNVEKNYNSIFVIRPKTADS